MLAIWAQESVSVSLLFALKVRIVATNCHSQLSTIEVWSAQFISVTSRWPSNSQLRHSISSPQTLGASLVYFAQLSHSEFWVLHSSFWTALVKSRNPWIAELSPISGVFRLNVLWFLGSHLSKLWGESLLRLLWVEFRLFHPSVPATEVEVLIRRESEVVWPKLRMLCACQSVFTRKLGKH